MQYDSPGPEWYEPPDLIEDDDEEWGPDSAQQELERGPR